MRKLSQLITSLIRSRVLQHILFWIFSFYILLRVFTDPGEYPLVDIIYTGLFHFTIWMVVYPNLLLLIPRLLQKERYFSYFISLIALILAGVFFNIFFFEVLVDYVFPGYYFISYYEFIDILQFFLAYIVITSLIKLSRSWFAVLEKDKAMAQMAEEKKIAELKALKSQVNPHFLFNNLNNIYGQALKSDPQTPETIVKLSNVLRYMIYEADKEHTSLNMELDYIGDYVELEKTRNENLNINYVIKGRDDNRMIVPLLFIPLIENAFKYCSKNAKSFVNIEFDIGDNIRFKVSNSVDDKKRNSSGGLGIRNVKRRLELQYPKGHKLEIVDEQNRFNVELTIYG